MLPSSNTQFSRSLVYWDLFWATTRFLLRFLSLAGFSLWWMLQKMSRHQQSRCSGSSDLQLGHGPNYALKSKVGLPFHKQHCFTKWHCTESAPIWYNLMGRTDALIIHSLEMKWKQYFICLNKISSFKEKKMCMFSVVSLVLNSPLATSYNLAFTLIERTLYKKLCIFVNFYVTL